MEPISFMAMGFELGDDFFDVLSRVFLGDQGSVRRVDDDEVLYAHGSNEVVIASHEGVLSIDKYGFAQGAVAIFVGCNQRTQRGPGDNVAPAQITRHDGNVTSLFHDGIVDGYIGLSDEGFAGKFNGMLGRIGRGPAGTRGSEHLWAGLGHGIEEGAGSKAEHAGVPVEVDAGEIALRGGGIGLFYETPCHPASAEFCGDDIPRFDVAKAGFRRGGLDAEGGQVTTGSQVAGGSYGGSKRRLIFDQMVGRQNQQASIGAMGLLGIQGRECDSRGGVAPTRFQQVTRSHIHLAGEVFVLGLKVIITVGNGEDFGHAR